MRQVKVAINGLGRIGRAFLKLAVKEPALAVLAVNDLGDPANLAYLLKYDSAYGRSGLKIAAGQNELEIEGQKIKFLQIREPSQLPWGELGIDVVVEATGVFETYEKARSPVGAGGRRVVVTAPIKVEPAPGVTGATVLVGLNEEALGRCQISSNASCTTNAAAPVIKILHEALGIEKALLNTVHAYTASQKLVDGPDAKDWRRGRAAAQNIIPSTTGAALSVTEALPELRGRFDGIALRVPVLAGSIADLTFVSKRPTTRDEVNAILKKAATEPRWQGIFTASDEPLVSADIVGTSHAAIADLQFTKVVGGPNDKPGFGNLVKVLAWYDNESGYAATLIRHVLKAGQTV